LRVSKNIDEAIMISGKKLATPNAWWVGVQDYFYKAWCMTPYIQLLFRSDMVFNALFCLRGTTVLGTVNTVSKVIQIADLFSGKKCCKVPTPILLNNFYKSSFLLVENTDKTIKIPQII